MMHCIGNEPSGNLLGIVISVGKRGHKKKVYVYFHFFFDIFTKLNSEYWLCRVCLSILMEQHLTFHSADFHEIDI
jgi:hypothetical protein